MRKAIFLVVVLVLATASVAVGDSIDGFTVIGNGGLSSAVAGVSSNSFWWAGTGASTEVNGSILRSYDFDPLSGSFRGVTPPPFAENGLYSGSLLLSNSFTVNGSQAISLTYGALSGAPFAFGNFAFALLLNDSQVAAVLGVVSPMNLHSTSDEPFLGTIFTSPSPGVQLNVDFQTQAYPAGFQLGSSSYGCFGDSAGPCQSEFTSTYTPGAGTYQLLFGDFGNANAPTAVAVKSVRVPEERTLLESFTALLLSIPYILWRKKAERRPLAMHIR